MVTMKTMMRPMHRTIALNVDVGCPTASCNPSCTTTWDARYCHRSEHREQILPCLTGTVDTLACAGAAFEHTTRGCTCHGKYDHKARLLLGAMCYREAHLGKYNTARFPLRAHLHLPYHHPRRAQRSQIHLVVEHSQVNVDTLGIQEVGAASPTVRCTVHENDECSQ